MHLVIPEMNSLIEKRLPEMGPDFNPKEFVHMIFCYYVGINSLIAVGERVSVSVRAAPPVKWC